MFLDIDIWYVFLVQRQRYIQQVYMFLINFDPLSLAL